MTEFSFLCKFILEFSCVLSICVSSLKLQCTEHWLSATQRLLLFSVSSLHLSSIKCERQNVIRQLVFWFLTFSDYHLHSPECVLWHLIEHHGEPARHTHTHTLRASAGENSASSLSWYNRGSMEQCVDSAVQLHLGSLHDFCHIPVSFFPVLQWSAYSRSQSGHVFSSVLCHFLALVGEKKAPSGNHV